VWPSPSSASPLELLSITIPVQTCVVLSKAPLCSHNVLLVPRTDCLLAHACPLSRRTCDSAVSHCFDIQGYSEIISSVVMGDCPRPITVTQHLMLPAWSRLLLAAVASLRHSMCSFIKRYFVWPILGSAAISFPLPCWRINFSLSWSLQLEVYSAWGSFTLKPSA